MNRNIVRAYVIVKNNGKRVDIDRNNFVLGKSEKADYSFRDNPAVSKIHAAIRNINGVFYIEDLNSLNHTFMDGEITRGLTELYDGALITLANEVMTFHLIVETAAGVNALMDSTEVVSKEDMLLHDIDDNNLSRAFEVLGRTYFKQFSDDPHNKELADIICVIKKNMR